MPPRAPTPPSPFERSPDWACFVLSLMSLANFATPPDGQRPRMRMYLYTMTVPARDGDIAIGTVIHEYVVAPLPLSESRARAHVDGLRGLGLAVRYAHGLSNRLTGGPDTTSCLGAAQSGGMGEGWGDWISVVFRYG